MLFFLLYLIYPSTSASIFGTFVCLELDDGTSWLRRDLSVSCDDDAYALIRLYAIVMVLVYPIGTPLIYYYLLRRCERPSSLTVAPPL